MQLANKLAHGAPDSKCYITFGRLSGDSVPEKSNRRPYTTVRGHTYNQQVDVLLPDEICELVQQKLEEELKPLQYHRIFMGLKEILEAEFYNNYIRKGNVLLLSDGRIDVDDVYCLYDGILYLFLRKETYEKAGLVGKQATFGGRKKERWVVEHDLRQPHMVHGRKAFDRLVWSFTNVFKEQKRWLFCDLQQDALVQSLAAGAAVDTKLIGLSVSSTLRTATPDITRSSNPIKLATFNHTVPQSSTSEYDRQVFYDWAYSFHEWLALATLNADRLNPSDSTDSLLSRYEPPADDTKGHQLGKIAKLSWRGFLPPEYISKIFDSLLRAVPKNQWFSITAHGFQNAPVSWKRRQHSAISGMGGENLYTILRFSQESGSEDVDMEGAGADVGGKDTAIGPKYVMWEVVGGRDEHS
ncbi:hypothetical protein H072_5367 [Dactylellina haptotyla CBS 200.50]|uniref:Uncharacterized protein n=1 Tax=Dactylellina haptotyla (strain CBS 200.50) TaxID=1284197 RepID=S8ACL7_DACHA|nr:hypothetical protein H072_5367 [Dactylellina haptotyla CBS 200.50]